MIPKDFHNIPFIFYNRFSPHVQQNDSNKNYCFHFVCFLLCDFSSENKRLQTFILRGEVNQNPNFPIFIFSDDPGLKPYFIKKLPARVEILERGNLSFGCKFGKTGCRPWFIKKLPPRVEIRQCHHLHVQCQISEASEENIKLAATQFYKEKTTRKVEPKKIERTGEGFLWTQDTRQSVDGEPVANVFVRLQMSLCLCDYKCHYVRVTTNVTMFV